ncbi:MAG: V-type ATP synthase subunit D [Candidatus Baldrarchaeia archaeon]
MELLILRRRKILAEKGRDLLEEKRDALIMEFRDVLEKMYKVREEVNERVKDAFKELSEVKMLMGPLILEEIASNIPQTLKLKVKMRNIMGVRVPLLKVKEKQDQELMLYSFIDTSSKLDTTIEKFRKALRAILRLAEIEGAVRRLAEEIKKTKRRVNALKYVIIPKIENTIRYIEFYLEEMEREDFFRLKRIKSLLEKKSEERIEAAI